MSDLKVCRICLCKGVKVYNYDSFNLKQYYEEIMGKKVGDIDSLPNCFCYECAALLYKFHKFKEKCSEGENILIQMLWSGSITLSSILQIDRRNKNLKSTIDIISVNKRVKTLCVKSKSLSENETNEIKSNEIIEVEESNVDNDSDNSIDDRNLAEIKNAMINEKVKLKKDEETNLDVERNTEKKAIPELEDDRNFSNDEDSWPDTVEVDKLFTKEKITIDEQTTLNTDRAESNDKSVLKEKPKVKRRKKKDQKDDINNPDQNNLDPKHWLKIHLTEEEALEEFRAKALDRKYLSAAYKCTVCYRGFSKEDMLNRHKTTHSESRGPVECRFCHMRFKWKCFLSRHLPKHYTKYKCLRCDVICPLQTTAVYHNEYHNGVVRKCIPCGEEFRHLTTYYTHLRTHRSEHVCTLCGASFVSVMGLNQHKRSMHINTVVDVPQGEEQYCQRCDVKFETRKAYEEHLIHSANHVDGVEDLEKNAPITSKPRKRQQNVKKVTKIPTDCHTCGKHFESQAACRKHHLAEHPRTSFFAPNERHICEICGMSLAPISIWSHLNTHTREKVYTCDTCGRQFSSKTSLNRHQLTHSSEKPAACTLCDKRFKQVSSMKLHYRTFHLKEPYPKRNRKKKNDELSKDEFGPEDSDDNMTLDNFYSRKY